MRKKNEIQVIEAKSPMELLSTAVTQNCDIATLERLEGLYEREQSRNSLAAFNEAMNRFGEIKEPIKHNRKGKTAGNAPFSYADYPATVNAIAPWMTDCGLSFSHRQDPPIMSDKGKVACIMVHCKIQHAGGHSEEFPFPAIPDERLDGKVSPSQLIQLAVTYAKRQTLCMGLGLATEEDKHDDDSRVVVDKLITEEQAINLQSVIDEIAGFDSAAFFKWVSQATKLEITKLSEIPASAFKPVLRGLEEKRKGV